MKKLLITNLIVLSFFISCKENKARKPISQKNTNVLELSAQKNKKILEQQEKMFDDYIKNDSLNNYKKSSSGFWKTYLSNPKPENKLIKGDLISYKHSILSLQNDTLYSYPEKFKVYNVDKEKLFYGLRESLKTLQKGDTIKTLIPSEKAFGTTGDNNKININQPIICLIIVNNIINNN